MKTVLKKEDWEEVKNIAEEQIKQANKVLEIQSIILEQANNKLKSFPKDDKQKLY